MSIGGGAIESAKTRALLDKEAITVWLQSLPETIINRLKKSDRPSLSQKPLDEEVHETMQRREPLYREVADITLPPNMQYKDQIPLIQKSLQAQCSW